MTSVKQTMRQRRSQQPKPELDLRQFADDLLSQLNVEDIYTHPSHQFKASGNRHRGGCPYHESKSGSSFVVSEDSLLFWCEGCRRGGSAIDYLYSLKVGHWDKSRGLQFIETLKQLAQLAGVPFPERELSPEQVESARFWESRRGILQTVADYGQEVLWSARGTEARQYLIQERGLTEEGIRNLGLGLYLSAKEVRKVLTDKGHTLEDAKSAGVTWKKLEGYILFLWLDSRNRPLTIYGRYHIKTPPQEKPKTIALPGQGTKASPLYFDRALKAGHRELVLVEGVLDAALLQSVGDTRVCAYVAASCSDAQIETMKRHGVKTVTLCGDPDEGGENGTHHNIDRITKAEIQVYVAPKLPNGLDPDEFLNQNGIDAWKHHIDSAIHSYTWKAQKLIQDFGSGDLTDKKKSAILRQVIAFRESLKSEKNKADFEVFFLPTICAEIGVNVGDFLRTSEGGGGGNNGNNGNGDGDGDGDNSDEDDGWNAPISWNGQIGWMVPCEQDKFEPDLETGEMTQAFDDNGRPIKEKVTKFVAKCNFDFLVERELASEDGGGVVLQLKRVFDGVEHQKRVVIKSTDYTEKNKFVDALKISLGTGVVCNLKTEHLGALMHSRLKEYRKRGGKVYRLADRMGQQEDGTWVFSDRQFTKDGLLTSEEETHWVFNPNLGKEDFIPCPQVTQKDSNALRNLIEAQRKFAGSNFMQFLLCDGYVAAALNYQSIMSVDKYFPILNPTGDPGGMKTVAVQSALSIAGWGNSDQGALASASISMAYERLKCLGSIPSLWDDPASKTRQDKEALDEFFKRQYNALPRTVRGNTQKPHSAIIPTTNHSLGEMVPAAKTRIIPLFMPVIRDGDRAAWQELSEAREKASGAFEYLISIGYPRSEVKALQARLQKHLPTAHERAADNLSILVFYTQKVVELARFEIDVERWVIENLCSGLNTAQTGLNSSTDFFEKLGSLKATNQVGLWNCDVVETKSHGRCLALHMPSVWPAIEQQFSPAYNYPVLEQVLLGLGAIKNKPAKLYPNKDITLAYIRELHKGVNKGEDWSPPKKPDPVTKKCTLIPQVLWERLGIDFVNNEDPPDDTGGSGGSDGGSPPPTPPVPSEPVTSVTSGNLDRVTSQTPCTAKVLTPYEGVGNLVTRNSQSIGKEISDFSSSGDPNECGSSSLLLFLDPSVTSPVTSVTSGNLVKVTDYNAYAASILIDANTSGNLVTKNDDEKEKTEEVKSSPSKVETCSPEKTQTDAENLVTRLPVVAELPKMPTTTTLEAVTSSRLPEVTEVTSEVTEASDGGELVSDQLFKVGDRVIWDNCPGHIASWNPFTITEIRGDKAELAFVEKSLLAPLVQLRRVV